MSEEEPRPPARQAIDVNHHARALELAQDYAKACKANDSAKALQLSTDISALVGFTQGLSRRWPVEVCDVARLDRGDRRRPAREREEP
jgi:hypothetical protein